MDSFDARLVRLAPALAGSQVKAPATQPLHEAYRSGAQEAFERAVRELHFDLLGALTAADAKLGRSFTVGRALHELHESQDGPHLVKDFRFHRVLGLCRSLEDLKDWFPPHAARGVSLSLREWRDWIDAEKSSLDGRDKSFEGRVRNALLRQGDIWRGVLTGEQRAVELLSSADYVDAAVRLAQDSQTLVGRLVRRYWLSLLAAVGLVVAALAVATQTTGAARVITSVAAVAGALGITWKGVGASIAQVVSKLREPLWTRQLDVAVATAIDQVPRPSPARTPGRQPASRRT